MCNLKPETKRPIYAVGWTLAPDHHDPTDHGSGSAHSILLHALLTSELGNVLELFLALRPHLFVAPVACGAGVLTTGTPGALDLGSKPAESFSPSIPRSSLGHVVCCGPFAPLCTMHSFM